MTPNPQTVGQAIVGALVVVYCAAWLLIQLGALTPAASASPATALQSKVDDLHEWHDQRDANGVLLWWVPRSLSDSIEAQTDSIEAQTTATREHTLAIQRLSLLLELLERP